MGCTYADRRVFHRGHRAEYQYEATAAMHVRMARYVAAVCHEPERHGAASNHTVKLPSWHIVERPHTRIQSAKHVSRLASGLQCAHAHGAATTATSPIQAFHKSLGMSLSPRHTGAPQAARHPPTLAISACPQHRNSTTTCLAPSATHLVYHRTRRALPHPRLTVLSPAHTKPLAARPMAQPADLATPVLSECAGTRAQSDGEHVREPMLLLSTGAPNPAGSTTSNSHRVSELREGALETISQPRRRHATQCQ